MSLEHNLNARLAVIEATNHLVKCLQELNTKEIDKKKAKEFLRNAENEIHIAATLINCSVVLGLDFLLNSSL